MSEENVMLQIGDSVKLGMDGAAYNQFKHELEANWAVQERINRRPSLQWTGVGTEKITLTGDIYPLLTRGGVSLGINTLRVLENLLLTPEPRMVLDGTGRRYGYFIVRSLSEDRSRFIQNGAPQKQTFTFVLERYGEDMLRDDAILGNGNTDLLDIRAAATGGVA